MTDSKKSPAHEPLIGMGSTLLHISAPDCAHPIPIHSSLRVIDLSQTIANPGPLGLFAFSLTTVFLSFANAGIVELDFEAVVWCYALAWGGATQWVAGLLEFFKNNLFGATVFCTYGAFWLGLAVFKFVVGSKILSVSSTQAGMALFFSAWGALSIIFLVGSLRVSVALSSIFVPLILAFFTLVGGQYNTTSLRAGGWFGIIAALLAFYLGSAQFLNDMYQSEVLPVGDLSGYWKKRKVGN
ncbi:hypothetical protein HDU93_000015 [Gonapodya sp. JEL0774]|nr:hypothetical protein HDU93_000015 [Gonapodya sp. JEL0774]